MASRLLLDTHTFLWWRTDSRRLGESARDAIGLAEVVFVSVASAWEAAIKISLGRLRLPEPFEAGIDDSGFERLPVGFEHTEKIQRLPLHHRDPFDRMLIVQAVAERLTLVSSDAVFDSYDVPLLSASA